MERKITSKTFSGMGYEKFYEPGGDGNMYAFDLRAGELAWRTKVGATGYWNEHQAACVDDGNVYTDNFDGCVYCFDAFTGKLKWSQYMGDCPYEPYKSWYDACITYAIFIIISILNV